MRNIGLTAVTVALLIAVPACADGQLPDGAEKASSFFGLLPLPDDDAQASSANARFSREFSISGSKWDEAARERDVFFARLQHRQGADRTWDIRLGRGAQI